MPSQRRLGFMVLGAGGYMGGQFLAALTTIIANLRSKGIEAYLEAVIEPVKDRREAVLAKAQESLGYEIASFERLSASVGSHINSVIKNQNKYDMVLVYDASPPSSHYPHLKDICELYYQANLPVWYLGEKPLLIDLDQVDDLKVRQQVDNYFCEFIETANPILLAAKEFLNTAQAEIIQGWCWRAGSTGIKWAVGDARKGASGGSLLDKGPHDLSITHALLGPEVEFEVTSARFPIYLLYPNDFLTGGRPAFLTISGERVSDIQTDLDHTELLPADACFAGIVDCALNTKIVRMHYFFSWIGLTQEPEETTIISMLETLDLPIQQWLDTSGERISNSGRFRYQQEEVRLIVLQIEVEGKLGYLVCNLLQKYGRVRRFAVAKIREGNAWRTKWEHPEAATSGKPMPAYEEQKEGELAEIVSTVVAAASGQVSSGRAAWLGSRAVLKVHEALLKLQEQAYLRERDKLDKALKAFKHRIGLA